MGAVFRARDTRLKRDVALKVLTMNGGDADRARFEREAQVLASLNHPRIAQVFGVEDVDGTPVIVMELVEGVTLAERIARGPLPIDEALAIATQICDGLEAAHERGIVHRDLKPANIKLRADGSATILDFGLARAVDGDASNPAASPTMVTAVASVIGTAAYMSPEQARARAVDKRTDIWAFGCVLFEMLTGVRAFAGESTTDVLAAVVQNEPDWTNVPVSTPPRVVDVIRRCLQKNVKDRLRDIADVRYELTHADAAAAGPRPRPAPDVGRVFRPGIAIAAFVAGALVAAVSTVVLTMSRSRDVKPAVPLRSTINLPPDTTLALSRGSAIALSSDGHMLAFAGRAAGKTQLYLRPLDAFDTKPVPGTDGAENPFFSPDGRWVGFFADNKLKKVAVDGGAPVTIADARAPRGNVWASGDTIYVTPTNIDPVMRVSVVGGKPTPVTVLSEGEFSHRWPHALPGGALLFAIWNDNGWEPSRIAVQAPGSQTHRVVLESNGGYPHYLHDTDGGRGYLVYARAEGLMAAPFEENALTLAGPPVPIVDSVMTNLSGGAHFDLAPTGTLAYVTGSNPEAERELAWVDLSGKSEVIPHLRVTGLVFALAPDAKHVATITRGRGDLGIWIDDLVGGGTRPVTDRDDFAPLWARDGSFIIYTRGAQNTDLLRRPLDGGPERKIVSGPRLVAHAVSPDNQWLAYARFDPVSASDIWIAPLNGGEPKPFVATNYSEGNSTFSPDGRWLAYQSNATGRFEIYARTFPDGQQAVQLTTEGGLVPQWSADGKTIFFRTSTNNRMMALPIEETQGTLRAGAPRDLFDASRFENRYDVAPDGKRLLMMPLMTTTTAATQIQLVTNFLADLKQRVR
jgi:serine/threonine-protein kinase